MSAPLLAIDHLDVSYADGPDRRRVVHGISLDVAAGEVVALVGESGSGKTTLVQAVIGLLPEGGRIDGGAIRLAGTDIAGWSQRRLDALRGERISLIPQDPGSSLNPVKTIGAQVGEILRLHRRLGRAEIREASLDLLAQVGLSQPALRLGQYPHQLSGGMKQRVLIAIATALRPSLIIADEPTSALDVTVQKRILDLIDTLRRESGTALLLVTHDLGVAADRADRIVVLRDGSVQERGPAAAVLSAPRSAYTRQLLADIPSLAAPRLRPIPAPREGPPAVVVETLARDYPGAGRRPFRAVDGLSFTVAPGTTHAIVGESGSGKSTTIRAIVGLERPSAGRILVDGLDLATLRGDTLRAFRRRIQLVYQNPFSSLDPRQTIEAIVEEPLLNFEPVARAERARRVAEIVERVGLPSGLLRRRPAALSGGQRQRVAIARALVLEPKILILDEAVSALDVTVQAQILRLLDGMQAERGLTYLFVSHDLAVVRRIADTVTVLRDGRAVEQGTVEAVFERPRDPYTRDLIAAIPGQRLPAPRPVAAEA
ncbi:dipeptide ABC transporter ATP-binding protein [Methylobacterium sp. E-066]|uniref:dipeptide ABC transporter ATP-binding protein n=1 Tax=Methylobacterium sp. E-066 TaxID=2836584 RepID=UPI001FB91A33|nr:ABC transporter ATP-binding protein [Methylobacterium sp. E-066]MCJ2144439.1 ABC transporter ATP-binding protein [Methylobacterium sp. E-066]